VDESGFAKNYGWIFNAKRVSEFEGMPLAWVFDMACLQFLNDLSYLKARDANEKLLNGKQPELEEYT